MIPRKDTVLFAPAGNKDIVEKMIDHGEKAYEQGENKISKKLLMFLREGKELITYENKNQNDWNGSGWNTFNI